MENNFNLIELKSKILKKSLEFILKKVPNQKFSNKFSNKFSISINNWLISTALTPTKITDNLPNYIKDCLDNLIRKVQWYAMEEFDYKYPLSEILIHTINKNDNSNYHDGIGSVCSNGLFLNIEVNKHYVDFNIIFGCSKILDGRKINDN